MNHSDKAIYAVGVHIVTHKTHIEGEPGLRAGNISFTVHTPQVIPEGDFTQPVEFEATPELPNGETLPTKRVIFDSADLYLTFTDHRGTKWYQQIRTDDLRNGSKTDHKTVLGLTKELPEDRDKAWDSLSKKEGSPGSE